MVMLRFWIDKKSSQRICNLEASSLHFGHQPTALCDRQVSPKLQSLSEFFSSWSGMEAMIYMGIPVDELLLSRYKDRVYWLANSCDMITHWLFLSEVWILITFRICNKGSLQICWELYLDEGALCSASDSDESHEPCEAPWLFAMRWEHTAGKWFPQCWVQLDRALPDSIQSFSGNLPIHYPAFWLWSFTVHIDPCMSACQGSSTLDPPYNFVLSSILGKFGYI